MSWARRQFVRAAFAAGAGALTLGLSRAAKAQEKLSKLEAAYQDGPKDDQACSECTKFQPPAACSVVAGDISSRGWCNLFEEAPE
jgi:hypothetical protein